MTVLARASRNLPDRSTSKKILILEGKLILHENVTLILRELATIKALSLCCDTMQEDRQK
jgi:hypothetical protein